MKLLKFGGTSVGSPERILNVIRIIHSSIETNPEVAVVFSAFGGVTDQLIETSSLAAASQKRYVRVLADLEKRHRDAIEVLVSSEKNAAVHAKIDKILEELRDTIHGVFLVKELSPKTLDFVMSFGERLSACLISECLKACGIHAEYLDARSLVRTDNQFGNARVDLKITKKKITDYFKSHSAVQCITGFIGSTAQNETTTLGRGGSDYTASLFGTALKVTEVEIWTDVDGVMTADPHKVKKAFPIMEMSFEEAMEMSHFGAKVIHPPTLQPASGQNIPIRIRNTFNPDFPGTVIGKNTSSRFMVKGISSMDHIALLRVQGSGMVGVVGISSRLFGALAKSKINVVLISQASSEHSICFAVDPCVNEQASRVIEEEFALEILAKQMDRVIIEKNLSIVAVVGENMRRTPGIAGRLFQALGKNGVNVVAIAQGSSELNISVVIPRQDESKALNALHDAFFLSGTKTLNLFILGTGLIGSTLLRQMKEQSATLSEEHSIDIRLVAVGNINGMVFSEDGISFDRWEEDLNHSSIPMVIERFVERMKQLNLPNSVFVDCTGSKLVVDQYENVLNASISIVTPNKIANSGKYNRYKRLKDSASKHGVQFLYETNVGAGLPVISTLKDLIASGDRILKIEAVLSGTISYIFNSFSADQTFSTVVQKAVELGLSEPDPRDDLSGVDVARKLLILARDAGSSMEYEDILVDPILPKKCSNAKSVESFFTLLKTLNSDFENRRLNAEKRGKRLRYIASFENGKARISLEEVIENHPFYALSGSDNMIVFTTERYQERPLVIKGPGAGAEVTAAGVFADIVRIASHLIW